MRANIKFSMHLELNADELMQFFSAYLKAIFACAAQTMDMTSEAVRDAVESTAMLATESLMFGHGPMLIARVGPSCGQGLAPRDPGRRFIGMRCEDSRWGLSRWWPRQSAIWKI